MAEREIMTLEEVAAYLRVHQSTIYRCLRRKEIPAFRMGSDWRFVRGDVDAWCDKKTVADVEAGPRSQDWHHGRTSARKKAGA